MQIDCRKTTNGIPVLYLSGRLDFSRRQEFLDLLDRFLEDVSALAEVRVDCSQLTYLDSSGLGLLLVLRDRARSQGCAVALVDCSQGILEILNTVQFGRLFRVA